jgi:hypothetical protein
LAKEEAGHNLGGISFRFSRFFKNEALTDFRFPTCEERWTLIPSAPATRRCSSGVEQLIRNEQVAGSNPASGSSHRLQTTPRRIAVGMMHSLYKRSIFVKLEK